jgi:hypothetical protein
LKARLRLIITEVQFRKPFKARDARRGLGNILHRVADCLKDDDEFRLHAGNCRLHILKTGGYLLKPRFKPLPLLVRRRLGQRSSAPWGPAPINGGGLGKEK